MMKLIYMLNVVATMVAAAVAVTLLVLTLDKNEFDDNHHRLMVKYQRLNCYDFYDQRVLTKQKHDELQATCQTILDSNASLMKQNEEMQKIIREMHQHMKQCQNTNITK